MGRCGLNSCGSEYGDVASSCVNDGEHSFPLKFWECLEYLRKYQLYISILLHGVRQSVSLVLSNSNTLCPK